MFDGAAVAQALGAVWLAVIIVLLVVRVVSSAHPEGTRRLLVGGAVGATLFITVVVTLIVYGYLRWQAGRQTAR